MQIVPSQAPTCRAHPALRQVSHLHIAEKAAGDSALNDSHRVGVELLAAQQVQQQLEVRGMQRAAVGRFPGGIPPISLESTLVLKFG